MFEFLFKYPAAAFDRGTIVFASGWSLWLLIALILAGIAALGYLQYRNRTSSLLSVARQSTVWILQSLLLALLLVMLWQPALSVSALKAQQNVVAVILDDSKSMALSEDGSTRREKAVKALDGGLLKELKEKFQVRLYRTGEKLQRIDKLEDLKSGDRATRLADSMKEIVAESGALPIGAVVLLSDGAENSGEGHRDQRRANPGQSTAGLPSFRCDQLPPVRLRGSKRETHVARIRKGFGRSGHYL
jgi:hypothetical protein